MYTMKDCDEAKLLLDDYNKQYSVVTMEEVIRQKKKKSFYKTLGKH